ncbi:MAG: hypothetical protein ACRDDY_10770 [Clostridium sp.]|uniref:hypothetical protein n=1 Tax=Clostridium sp. TaxID=1506 RepID=UPI003EE5E906
MIFYEKDKNLVTGQIFPDDIKEKIKEMGVEIFNQPPLLEERYYHIENRKKKDRRKNKKKFGKNKR